ncbi:MAG: electron transfer flavoprotein subunit beta/FixA family protein [Promethearchaeota archaeon]
MEKALTIFVCIKQVPGISEIKIDPKTNTLIRENVPSIMNPNDKHAIELALLIKEQHGADIIALSMGPSQAEEILREALAMGVDKAVLLTDCSFAGADTLATSYTLALAIKKLLKEKKESVNYLVICGTQAIDGATAQVGPELAEELGIPQITYVIKFQLKENKIVVERTLEPQSIVIIESPLPALISVLNKINEPRYPALIGIVHAFQKNKIIYFNAQDLDADKAKIGLNGSMTEVWKIFIPERKDEHVILKGTPKEISKELCLNLKKDKVF